MPSSVTEVFSAANISTFNVVAWGTRPLTSASGVYIVSLTDSIKCNMQSLIKEPPLNQKVFEDWLQICPNLTLDQKKPTIDQLIERIRRFWLPDESILYIGKATTLSNRLNQYYRTPIGARAPHSGGYFLKLLSNIDELWVHYAECNDPHSCEFKMLSQFIKNVSSETKQLLLDPVHPFPFANLEWPVGSRKRHGLKNARQEKASVESRSNAPKRVQLHRAGSNLYTEIWRSYSVELKNFLESQKPYEKIQLLKSDFQRVGNRKSYTFRLSLKDTINDNNINGSAVARDLHDYLVESPFYNNLLRNKNVVIRLDQTFTLHLYQEDIG